MHHSEIWNHRSLLTKLRWSLTNWLDHSEIWNCANNIFCWNTTDLNQFLLNTKKKCKRTSKLSLPCCHQYWFSCWPLTRLQVRKTSIHNCHFHYQLSLTLSESVWSLLVLWPSRLLFRKQGRIHGHQLQTGGQGWKCAFSHFSTRWLPKDRPMDGQSLL